MLSVGADLGVYNALRVSASAHDLPICLMAPIAQSLQAPRFPANGKSFTGARRNLHSGSLQSQRRQPARGPVVYSRHPHSGHFQSSEPGDGGRRTLTVSTRSPCTPQDLRSSESRSSCGNTLSAERAFTMVSRHRRAPQ